MANLGTISATIGANVQPLITGLNTGEKKLEEFGNVTKEVAQKVAQSSAAIGTNVKAGSDKAANALMNLGRVAQDAPFGFIGIQNNINPLLESFQRLKAETGTTGGAMKALVSSLSGPAGVGLAVSVVSSLILAFGDKLMALGEESAQVKKIQEAYRDALASTGGELAKEKESLNALLAVAKDETLSRQARTEALKEVQKEYPHYLQNITLETINSEKATKAVNNLTDALTRKAKVQSLTSLIQKTQEEIIQLQTAKLSDQATMFDKVVAAMNPYTYKNEVVLSGLNNQVEKVADLQKVYDDYVKQLQEVTKEQAKGGDFTGLSKTKDKVDQVAEALRKLKTDLYAIDAFSNGDILKDLRDKFSATESTIKRLIDLKVPKNGTILSPLISQAVELNKQIIALEARLKAIKGFQPFIAGTPAALGNPSNQTGAGLDRSGNRIAGLQSMFNIETEDKWYKKLAKDSQHLLKIYERIADALTDVFASIFQDGKISLDGIGDALMKLIGQLAQAALRAAILAALLSAVGFGVGPGGALIKGLQGSFGSIFGNLLGGGGISGHATGGIFTGPTMFGSHVFGEAGPEALIPLDRLDSMMQGMSAGNNVEVTGRIELGYNTLAVAIERKDRYRNRNYGRP